MVSYITELVNSFVTTSESLLAPGITPSELTERERQVIQFYLSALSAKFPALSE
jgi:hypothetical protein